MLGNFSALTTETQFIRLAYLLSRSVEVTAEVWAEDLEGFDAQRLVDL